MWKVCLHSPITAYALVAEHDRIVGFRTDGAIVARKLALGAGPIELVPADSTVVVGTLWQIPLPVGDCLVGLDVDLHLGGGGVLSGEGVRYRVKR